MKSCIVTPTWNNEDYTIRCFGSIAKNTSDYLIIWVDNGSTPESRQKVKDFLDSQKIPYEGIFNDENLGFVKATNQGMKRAMELGAKYIVLENNDTEVYNGWLDRMIAVAELDPKIGLVGPITSPCDSWQSIQTLKIKTNYIKDPVDFSNLPKYKNNPEEYAKQIKELYRGQSVNISPALAFFCTLIKSEVAKQIGILSEEYGIGLNDDDDYCTRARRAGWKINLALDIFVFHNHRTTFRAQFSEEEINEMKKKNLTKLGNKFADDEGYDFERFLEKGKMYEYKGKKSNAKNKKLSLFKEASYVLKKDGLKKFIEYTYKYIKYGKNKFK